MLDQNSQKTEEAEETEVQEEVRDQKERNWIKMPFFHDWIPDIRTKWSIDDFDPDQPNDEPNLNIAVMGLILCNNIGATSGEHDWSMVEDSLKRLGFEDIDPRYFEIKEQVNYPAMIFGKSKRMVKGKYVVAAVFRGSKSLYDFISDVESETKGFRNAGIHSANELKRYCKSLNLSKDNTILFITGHSYGAACASLCGIRSTDLADRDSIFLYPFAAPNYAREGLTGDGMKMFHFNNAEDIVPKVPMGHHLDKTGLDIVYDRLSIKAEHPEQYDRFLKLYRHFRGCDFDSDSNFRADCTTLKSYVKGVVNDLIIRNHKPSTYMPLMLCGLPEQEAYSYIVQVPKESGESPGDAVPEESQEVSAPATAQEEEKRIEMPFLHGAAPDLRVRWDLGGFFGPGGFNETSNMNLAATALILSSNIGATVGRHEWSLVADNLKSLGFTDIVHQYFENDDQPDFPAMVFGRSRQKVNGKYVVAAIYRGGLSYIDVLSDVEAHFDGFGDAGNNAANSLRDYCASQNLSKENTILYITGHGYGAACASLAAIRSTDIAERESIYCYAFATPNYDRYRMTGDGMKMFSFNNAEDILSRFPAGPGLDKTGVKVTYNRLTMQLIHPKQYALFLKLYKYLRGRDYDADYDFLPDMYTFKHFVGNPLNESIIRNHMTYTYMAFLLCGLSEKEVSSYMLPGER